MQFGRLLWHSATARSTRSTRGNVKNLQVAWSFSTGDLRGHEGGPLVIGDVMYVHTPFPNRSSPCRSRKGADPLEIRARQDPTVIPVMCCDTVNRGVAYARWQDLPAAGRHHAGGARCQDRQRGLEGQERRPEEGRDRDRGAGVVKDKVMIGISGGEFGVRGHLTAYDIKDRQASLAGLVDRPRQGNADRSARRPPIAANRSARTLLEPGTATSGRSAAAHLGLVHL